MLHQTVLKTHLKGLRDEANASGAVACADIDGFAVACMPGGHWYQDGEAVSFRSLCLTWASAPPTLRTTDMGSYWLDVIGRTLFVGALIGCLWLLSLGVNKLLSKKRTD